MEEDQKVLGHICAGLREHFAAATYGCIPRLTEAGTMSGCDDSNPIPIKHCPWCGKKLVVSRRAQVTGAMQ